ncbi:hypothetical protein BDV93DRAFT_604138 [Ceratobasidium sp. AG-I]|nr:hypothetical protein BDV93DRAFT_604138 [Ceratobasidium sp. AG-I]
MSSAELIDYVGTLIPDLSQEAQFKASCMLMHMITLMRSFDKVELLKVRCGAGKMFTAQIIRRSSLVTDLARALNIKTAMPYQPKAMPTSVEHRAHEIGLDIAEVQSRHKKLDGAVNEICRLSVFVQIAQTVMQAVHEDTLRAVDQSYQGHCHPAYIPKSWKFGKDDASLLGLKAFQLPGAHTPRAAAPRSIQTIASAASSGRSSFQTSKRIPAPTSSSSMYPCARRAAHPYARPSAAARQPALPAPHTGSSRPPRRHSQRPTYPTYISTQHALWHPTNVLVPSHVAAY